MIYRDRSGKEITFEAAIKLAEGHRACEDMIADLRAMGEAWQSHAKAPYWAYWYASEVLGGRWVEAEATIRTDPNWAYWYARDVIKGRWPEAEGIIRTDPYCAYRYALDVIKGRWE